MYIFLCVFSRRPYNAINDQKVGSYAHHKAGRIKLLKRYLSVGLRIAVLDMVF